MENILQASKFIGAGLATIGLAGITQCLPIFLYAGIRISSILTIKWNSYAICQPAEHFSQRLYETLYIVTVRGSLSHHTKSSQLTGIDISPCNSEST